MCSCFFRLPSPFFRHRDIRGNLYSDHTVIIIRIVVTPAVIFLFCYLSGFEFSLLIFPGHQTGIKFCRFCPAFSNFRSETDQPIHILNPNQFPVLQCKQRVHQSIHGINILDIEMGCFTQRKPSFPQSRWPQVGQCESDPPGRTARLCQRGGNRRIYLRGRCLFHPQ